jgi:peptidoglycan/xylan/chitin deacetylase (PgdA/CDA1 family)
MAVSSADFEAQCQWLQRSGRVVPLDKWIRRFRSTQRTPGSIAITFDDGFASVYDEALPILRRHSLPATVFVVGRMLEDDPAPVDWTATTPRAGLSTLTRDRIREMQRFGITFGAHGHTHRDLTTLSVSECQRDLTACRERLEETIGGRVTLLAYPFGRHNERVRDAARRAGYAHAFGTSWGQEPLGPYGIPRVGVYAGDRGAALRFKTSQLYLPVRRSSAVSFLRRILRSS